MRPCVCEEALFRLRARGAFCAVVAVSLRGPRLGRAVLLRVSAVAAPTVPLALRRSLCESGRISIRSVNDRTAFLLDIAHKDPSQFPEDHEIRPYELGQGASRKIEKLAISRAEIVNTSHVESAEASRGKENIVRISLTAKGGELMRDATKKMRKGRSRLAIIYDERIISAPVVAEEIWSRLILEGFNTFEEAKALATALNKPLSANLLIESLKPLARQAKKP